MAKVPVSGRRKTKVACGRIERLHPQLKSGRRHRIGALAALYPSAPVRDILITDTSDVFLVKLLTKGEKDVLLY